MYVPSPLVCMQDFEAGFETFREESDRRQELASLKVEEDALEAEVRLRYCFWHFRFGLF